MADSQKPLLPTVTTGPITFLKEVRIELMNVTWPSREDVVKLTMIVIVVSVVLGLYIGGLDIGLTKLTDLLVKR